MLVLVAYATKHGSTAGVAETIAEELRSMEVEVDLVSLGDSADLEAYDGVVLGAPIYNMRWLKPARSFLKRHAAQLAEKPVAIFALGPRADEPEAWERSTDQLERSLAKFEWLRPISIEVFGGADPEGKGARRDIRDWAMIRAWADGLPEAIDDASPEGER
jgi:menaquinone-dependent protoporphyrinogen oxidase